MARPKDKTILVDLSLCIGCKACQLACKEWHNLPATEFEKVPGTYQNPADRSHNVLMLMKFDEVYSETANRLNWIMSKDQCYHCTYAACVEVCPTFALFYHDDGFVGLDQSKCIGCTYCGQACPFDIPRYDTNLLTGQTVMNKCDFCQDKVTNGQEPACVTTCPTNCLTFRAWDDALAHAKERVGKIKNRYPNASVYGEHEMEGLHYLYVLTEKPEVHGLPVAPKSNSLVEFRRDVLKPLTAIAFGGVGLGLLTNFIVAAKNYGNKDDDLEEAATVEDQVEEEVTKRGDQNE